MLVNSSFERIDLFQLNLGFTHPLVSDLADGDLGEPSWLELTYSTPDS
jgi:hypothetical protein